MLLPRSVRIYLYAQPVDMRNGPDGLVALVERHFGQEVDVFSGHLFVFLSQRRDRIKILFFDHGGFVVYYKRMEKGRFVRPLLEGGAVHLTSAELASLLEGIDLTGARRTRVWEPELKKGIDRPLRL